MAVSDNTTKALPMDGNSLCNGTGSHDGIGRLRPFRQFPIMPTLYIKLAVIALVAIIGFSTGWKVNGWRKDADIKATQEQAQAARDEALANIKALEQEQQARASVAADLEIERNKQAKIIERIVTNDVIKYVQKPTSQHCGVDPDGVRLINTSAAGRMPESTSPAPAPDATAAAVVASVTNNYATCNANANQLMALQDWVRTLPDAT